MRLVYYYYFSTNSSLSWPVCFVCLRSIWEGGALCDRQKTIHRVLLKIWLIKLHVYSNYVSGRDSQPLHFEVLYHKILLMGLFNILTICFQSGILPTPEEEKDRLWNALGYQEKRLPWRNKTGFMSRILSGLLLGISTIILKNFFAH